MSPQYLEDLICDPMGFSVVLVKVMKYIAEHLPGTGPPCPVDGSLVTWINNKYALHIYDAIVGKIVINNHA